MIELKEIGIEKDKRVFSKGKECIYLLEEEIKPYVESLRKKDSIRIVTKNGLSREVRKKVDISGNRYKIKPFNHQIQAIDYGVNTKESWMLLDDCGLGKTLSMIYLAEELSRVEKIEHCLIICGVNSLKYNWADEIEKSSNKTYTILGQRVTRTGKKVIDSVAKRCEILKNKIDEFFVITNLETLQSKDFAKAYKESKNEFGMIILDEAHHAKSTTSLSGKNLLKLKADHCVALTGTIIMNNPENAYMPLKWTGNIGSNFTDFKKMFNVYGGFGGVQVIGYKNLDILQDLIASCSLRRRKSEVLDLPEKTYEIEYVEMGKEQQKLYDDVKCGVMEELDRLDHKPTVMEEITMNMRLRQITAYPGILSTDVTQSAKLDRLEELAEQIVAQGDKFIVFSTFRETVLEIEKRLSKYNPLSLIGGVSDSAINDAKKRFESDDSCKALILTWQKMGTGHTLTSANYAIFIDTPWTDADFQQACDRIHRIGQNKKVTIITLIAKDTYDERVQELLDIKENLSGYLIDNKKPTEGTVNILNE